MSALSCTGTSKREGTENVKALRTTSKQYTPPGDELENGMGIRLHRMPLMNEAHAVDQRLSDEPHQCCAVA